MKIYTIGGSGLVGTKIVEILQDKKLVSSDYAVDDLSLTNGVDITDPTSLDVIRKDTEHDVVLHIAAKTDVEGCEKDKVLGEDGAAYKINVLGTRNVAEAAKAGNKKLLYISTDYVFDGKKEPPYKYKEDDEPNPVNWYATTKYKGELEVQRSGVPYTIIRIGYPFRADPFELKNDFVHAIMNRLSKNMPLTAVTDHIMTPTFIDDIAYAIDTIISKKAEGIYHVVGSQSLSPYDAFMLMADKFHYDKNLITKISREELYKGKASRAFNLSINNVKITQLGVKMRTFEEGLDKVFN